MSSRHYINLGVVCTYVQGADAGLPVKEVCGRIGHGQIWPYSLSKNIAAFGVCRLGICSLSLQSTHVNRSISALFCSICCSNALGSLSSSLSVLLAFAIHRAPSSLPSTLAHVRGSISQHIELSRPRTRGTPLVRLFIFPSSR